MNSTTIRRLLIPFVFGAAITLALFFWWDQHRNRERPKEMSTTVHLGWLFSGAYGGEALASQTYGPQLGIQIELQPGGPGLDPLRLVKDGTFGVASADEVIRIIERGSPLVIVGVLNEDAPAAFAALESSNIKKPSDFVGKRVGMLPFGSTGLIYQALLARQKIKRDQIFEVPISADLRPFIMGATHEVQPIYIYDEPVSMDAQGVKYSVIIPKDYGVVFKGPVYFTTRNTVMNQPELVSRFIRACILGWRDALVSPDAAIDALHRIDPSIDVKRETAVLKRALPYYGDAQRKPLTSDLGTWTQMIEDMVAFKVIPRAIEPKTFIDLSFVDAAYREMEK